MPERGGRQEGANNKNNTMHPSVVTTTLPTGMTIGELTAAVRLSSGGFLSNGSDRDETDNGNGNGTSKMPFNNNPPPVSSKRKCLEDRYCDSMISLSTVRLNATEDAACILDYEDFENFDSTRVGQ